MKYGLAGETTGAVEVDVDHRIQFHRRSLGLLGWLRAGALAAVLFAPIAYGSPLYTLQRLSDLGIRADGSSSSSALAVNAAGDVAGSSLPTGQQFSLPVVWRAGSTSPTPLQLIPSSGAEASGQALGINNSGAIVGVRSNAGLGTRPQFWPPNGTAVSGLSSLSTPDDSSSAHAINSGGDTVGDSDKFLTAPQPTYVGFRAVRWSAGGTVATELGNLGTTAGAAGQTQSTAFGINDHGDIAGFAEKYSGGNDLGSRAVRWAAGGTAATELASPSNSNAQARAINNNGDAVGYASSAASGTIALSWAAGGTTFTSLGSLGTNASGSSFAFPNAIDDSGDIVGASSKYVNHVLVGTHATIWPAGGTLAVDLNDLVDLPSGWILTNAHGINDSGMIVASGTFDPDGSGPILASDFAVRLIPVPEPGAPIVLGFLISLLAPRSRKARSSRQ